MKMNTKHKKRCEGQRIRGFPYFYNYQYPDSSPPGADLHPSPDQYPGDSLSSNAAATAGLVKVAGGFYP